MRLFRKQSEAGLSNVSAPDFLEATAEEIGEGTLDSI